MRVPDNTNTHPCRIGAQTRFNVERRNLGRHRTRLVELCAEDLSIEHFVGIRRISDHLRNWKRIFQVAVCISTVLSIIMDKLWATCSRTSLITCTELYCARITLTLVDQMDFALKQYRTFLLDISSRPLSIWRLCFTTPQPLKIQHLEYFFLN